MTSPEHKLILQLQSGHKESFAPLYDEHVQAIYQHIFYKTLNQQLTEDIVSDTFFKAFDKIHQFTYKSEGSFRSWLYTIANNLLLDSYKKQQIDGFDDIGLFEGDEDITNQEHNRYLARELIKELDCLDPHKKDVLIMRLREGLTYEEIEQLTGRNNDSLRKDFSLALKELRVLSEKLTALMFFILMNLC